MEKTLAIKRNNRKKNLNQNLMKILLIMMKMKF